MVVDNWEGIGAYHSVDGRNWIRQGSNLVASPGRGPDDGVKGGHPDVVASGNRALFYFTHPGRRDGKEKRDGYDQRRSSIQVAELEFTDKVLTCDRDMPVTIDLQGRAAPWIR